MDYAITVKGGEAATMTKFIDEDGFPVIKVIVPPDEWDMNEAE